MPPSSSVVLAYPLPPPYLGSKMWLASSSTALPAVALLLLSSLDVEGIEDLVASFLRPVVVVVVDGVVVTDALDAGALGVGCGGDWSLLCLRRNLDLRVMVGIEEIDVRVASPTTVMLTFACRKAGRFERAD
jgi:hypothetical protein